MEDTRVLLLVVRDFLLGVLLIGNSIIRGHEKRLKTLQILRHHQIANQEYIEGTQRGIPKSVRDSILDEYLYVLVGAAGDTRLLLLIGGW